MSATVAAFAACGTSGTAENPNDAGSQDVADVAASPLYKAFAHVERWSRASAWEKYSMAAVVTYHAGANGDVPRYVPLDEHCGYHEGLWSEATHAPPRFGQLRFTAPSIGEVSFYDDPEGSGYDSPDGTQQWNAGDAIRVRASGADLPAFDLSDTVPAMATLTSVDLMNVAPRALVIPRDQPFVLTWTPVDTEVFALLLQFDERENRRHGLNCFFPGAAGTATIPVAALAHLVSNDEIRFTNFYFAGASRKHLALDRVDLEMVTWNGTSARVTMR